MRSDLFAMFGLLCAGVFCLSILALPVSLVLIIAGLRLPPDVFPIGIIAFFGSLILGVILSEAQLELEHGHSSLESWLDGCGKYKKYPKKIY